MRRGAEAARIAAHAHTELAADGADECRWMGHGPKELMRQLAGTPALVIPGEPAKSPFLEFASSRDMVRDSFSAEEIAVIRRWIEQGAEVPGQLDETAIDEDASDGPSWGEQRWWIGMGAVH